MKSILFIINKKSGTDRDKSLDAVIRKGLDAHEYATEISYTQYPGHATELTLDAVKRNVDVVVAVGGDGSVNEIARGLVHTHTLLGIVPKGSGNGLARALGLPMNVEECIKIIGEMCIRSIDVGYANDHLFLSNAGVGFDALIARLFARNESRGLFTYARLVIQSMKTYRPKNYVLHVDGTRIEEQAFFVAVANGNQFGYDFRIAPKAKLDDGMLDICLVRPLKWYHWPWVTVGSFTGTLQNSAVVRQLQGQELSIERREPLEWMQVDGEAVRVDRAPIRLGIYPKALSVLAPRPQGFQD